MRPEALPGSPAPIFRQGRGGHWTLPLPRLLTLSISACNLKSTRNPLEPAGFLQWFTLWQAVAELPHPGCPLAKTTTASGKGRKCPLYIGLIRHRPCRVFSAKPGGQTAQHFALSESQNWRSASNRRQIIRFGRDSGLTDSRLPAPPGDPGSRPLRAGIITPATAGLGAIVK